MNSPHLSVLHGGEPAAALPSAQDGTAQLNLHGPVQVHVHLGHGGPATDHAAPAGPRRHSLLPILLGLALAGGGYLAGSRNAGAPVHAADTADALLPPPGFPLPVPPAAPLPAQPRPGDVPPALQQQLARPGVVTPPPGAAAAPARNPFGLGN